MKKIFLLFTVIFVNIIAFSQGFIVNKFTADIYLNEEGYFDVVENYDVEFSVAKHGIFREITTANKIQSADGKSKIRKLVIENIDVPSNKFVYSSPREQRMEGKMTIKIGDKMKFITGLKHYEIKYRVHNAYLFEGDLVQFYWNVKPRGWQAIFKKVDINIHTPEGAVISPENCFLYAGYAGTTGPSTDFDYTYSNSVFTAQSHEFFVSIPEQDVTVLIKLPRNLITENIISIPVWPQYVWIGILVLLLIIFWLVWGKYGKDDKVISATSYYAPKDIDPAMAGYLINDKEDTSDLISLIPQWASQGLITIEEIPKSGIFSSADMKLTRLKNLPASAPDYQQSIFNSLFSSRGDVVLVSSLRNIFYVSMIVAKKELHEAAQKYYEPESRKVMKITIAVAVVLGILLCPIFLFTYGPLAAVSAPVVCVFIALMSFFLQKKNNKGNAVLSELVGFKQFIKMAEVNRIEILLKQDAQYFEKTMSYALAFGLLNEWSKKFDALNIQPPNWYTSSGTNMMGMQSFSKSFSGSMATAQSAMISSPSSSSSSGGFSGGGSSGGGFGGGGGGSW